MTVCYLSDADTRITEIKCQCYVGSVFLIVSAWVRYAGTSHSISTNASLCLLMLGQLLAGIAQHTFQVIGPFYSETWFGLKSRTTVTMIIGVANPFGTGIAQIISPVVGSVRTSILVLGIACTVAAPFALLMSEAPPTPPSKLSAASLHAQRAYMLTNFSSRRFP